MRFLHPDGSIVHLSYCSNVHPAEDVDGIVAQLARFAGPVREATGSDRLGLGLWIPARATHELAGDPAARDRLRSALAAQNLEVVTLNGFPYGGFHAPVVKKAVYRPDWTEQDRLTYTLDLARVLADLLPEDVSAGSISTLPFGWREGWTDEATKAALGTLRQLAAGLEALHDRTGRTIRVGLEPEPGCIVERTDQAADLLSAVAPGWVGICLDACHLAVQFEDPAAAIRTLDVAGVPIVKAQVSTALQVPDPGRPGASAALEKYVEPRFLHQTRERRPNGQVVGADDLDQALAGALARQGEWRVHFHTPVHWADESADGAEPTTTQPHLLETIEALLVREAVTTHLDVETYTWTVLPPDLRPGDDAGLIDGMARELIWTRDRLLELDLLELP